MIAYSCEQVNGYGVCCKAQRNAGTHDDVSSLQLSLLSKKILTPWLRYVARCCVSSLRRSAQLLRMEARQQMLRGQ